MVHTENDPTPIFCDNSSTITLSRHNVFHRKRKHIDTHYHFIHELVNNGDITLLSCGSKEQLIDTLTKPLGILAFEFKRNYLGLIVLRILSHLRLKGCVKKCNLTGQKYINYFVS